MYFGIERKPIFVLGVLLVYMFTSAHSLVLGQEMNDFESRLTEFTLENGLKFIVYERHAAPVISFHTYANVGSADEVKGITGMAHLFEHMAFKGSQTVGTMNYEAEAKIFAQLDESFLILKKEKQKKGGIDREHLKALRKSFEKLQKAASQYLVLDEFEEALIRAGASGLNASTYYDATQYTVSLPSNKLELWMVLESERFLNPVLREFYKEKDVVMEERRLRTESRPVGRLVEEFLAVAFKAHPYGEPVVGHMSDLETMTRQEAEKFFEDYYSPGNLTISIVGDVDPTEVRNLAHIYFGRIPERPKPGPVETVEPPQLGERRVSVEDTAQPLVLIGYHKPNVNHSDNAVFNTITDILGIGRTSRLHKNLVKEKRIAVSASAFQDMPGNKYPGLFLFYAMPAPGHTSKQCEEAIDVEIERLKSELVSVKDLEKSRTRSRASLVRSLASNRGVARELTYYEVVTGDWRNLFRHLDRIDKVTPEDIQRVAKLYFTSKNKTVGVLETVSVQGAK